MLDPFTAVDEPDRVLLLALLPPLKVMPLPLLLVPPPPRVEDEPDLLKQEPCGFGGCDMLDSLVSRLGWKLRKDLALDVVGKSYSRFSTLGMTGLDCVANLFSVTIWLLCVMT